MEGRISSYESLGAVDGPGLRFVVFFQGCPLRCACCHNPETWEFNGGQKATVEELMKKIQRCRSYFGREGGVTASGGEPLLQPGFLTELFSRCREQGIHTALDTSGCRLDSAVERVLKVTDLVLLDMKFTSEEEYRSYTGGSLAQTLRFLERLEQKNIPVWLRQVVIPSLNDSRESIGRVKETARSYRCVQRLEFLPFRKLCLEKYESMGISFPLAHLPECSPERIKELEEW